MSSIIYDLEADPDEKRNQATSEPETSKRLSARIRAWRAEQESQAHGRALEADPDSLEGLRALGYVDDAEPAHEAPPP